MTIKGNALQIMKCMSALMIDCRKVDANLDVRRSLHQPDDACHAVLKPQAAELGQDDGQNGMVVTGQEMLVHTWACRHQRFMFAAALAKL